jgi:hypothetical protein
VKRIKFEPKRIDGKAVDSVGMSQVFNFVVGRKPGITQEFRDELVKVGKLLDKKDYAGANFHAEWMLAEVVKLTYEYAVLQAQLAETYAKVGRTSDAIAKAWRATARSAPLPEFFQLQVSVPPNKASYYLLPKEITVNLLELRMRLLAKQGLYLEALQSYYELAGLVELKPDDPRTTFAKAVEATIKGPAALVGIVELGEREYRRRQFIARRSFTLENVQGSVKRITLRCSAKPDAELQYKPGVEWKIPAAWGACAADVEAQPGTTFEFVEYPDSFSAGPAQ